MELKINTSIARQARGDNLLYIFGKVPYWFVANKGLDIIMNQLEKGIDKEDLFSKIGDSSKKMICDFIDIGIVSQDGKSKGSIERISPKKRIWNVTDIAEFELTLRCNLRCRHCYIQAGISEGEEISKDTIKNTLEDLAEIHSKDLDGKRIVLTGGEPFTRNDLVDIVNENKRFGFNTLINSNGLLIRQDYFNELKDYQGLQICVSLDGLKKSHEMLRGEGTYEKTLEKIRQLSQSGIRTAINMLCHQDNYKELEGVMEETRDIELEGINPVPVVLMGNAVKYKIKPVPEKILFSEMFRLAKDSFYSQRMTRNSLLNFMGALACNIKSNYCGTGTRGTFFVSHLGDVYPCPNMRYEEFKLGNVNNQKFKDIVKNNPIIDRLSCLNVDTMNEECSDCDVKYFCGGFCRGETYSNTGDINSPYIRCSEYREGIIEAMWELSSNSKLYEKKAKEFIERSKAQKPKL